MSSAGHLRSMLQCCFTDFTLSSRAALHREVVFSAAISTLNTGVRSLQSTLLSAALLACTALSTKAPGQPTQRRGPPECARRYIANGQESYEDIANVVFPNVNVYDSADGNNL